MKSGKEQEREERDRGKERQREEREERGGRRPVHLAEPRRAGISPKLRWSTTKRYQQKG